MKNLYVLAVSVIVALGSYAQTPQKMSYQSVVRDAGQNLVNNQVIGVEISIIQGSMSGPLVYVERHTPTTNMNGLMTLEIGNGMVLSGDFNTIDWANGPYFVQTDTDLTGGTNYTISGTSQLLSVPYALYAENSGSSLPGPVGPQGQSAYVVWLSLGNIGTEQEFILSLTGPQGAQGPMGFTGMDGIDGADGQSAYEVWLSLGNSGTEADFIASLEGAQGSQGPQGNVGLEGPAGPQGVAGVDGSNGTDGQSAYEAWLNLGNSGSEADFITSLEGAQGIQGNPGVDGTNGSDGQSAYEVWLSLGNSGTEANFIASLEGPQGIPGSVGPQGPAGSYTAGNGINISGGVISAFSSTNPEFIFLQPDSIVGSYVGFEMPLAVNEIPFNPSTNEFTLKAGKFYMLDGSIYMNSTNSALTYSFVFYDKTNNMSIGTEAYQRTADYSGAIINQPNMSAIIKPAIDIQVGIRDVYGVSGDLIPSRGYIRVIQLK